MIPEKGSRITVLFNNRNVKIKSKGLQAYLDLIKEMIDNSTHKGTHAFNISAIIFSTGASSTDIPAVRAKLLEMYPKAYVDDTAYNNAEVYMFIGSGKSGAGVKFNKVRDITVDIQEFCFS